MLGRTVVPSTGRPVGPTFQRAALVALVALVSGLLPAPLAGPASALPGSSEAGTGDHATIMERGTGCVPRGGAFRPTRARVTSIGEPLSVVPVRRTQKNAVGAPPATSRGKRLVGWDPFTRPRSGAGTVIVVAHTFSNGSALGNRLLRSTKVGHRVQLTGVGGQVACYRVTQRSSYRHDRVPVRRAFRATGPEQLVIVVCSGRRTGPARWTHRTLWFAEPVR